jgi:hypothetical protein
MSSLLPPESEWTITMREINRLVSEPAFPSPEVRGFAGLNEGQFQAWFRRGVSSLKDPRPKEGSGYHRRFNLEDVVAIAAGVHIGRRVLGWELEPAIRLGSRISGYCVGRWLKRGLKFDQIGTPTQPEALAALKSLIIHVQSESPDSIEFLIDTKTQAMGASPYTSLGDVRVTLKEPVFTVLDARIPLTQLFFPAALRLFQKMAEQNSAEEIAELEALFVKA